MLNCKEVTHLLSESQERPLSLYERVRLGIHLAMCKGCTNFRKQLDFLRMASRRYASGAGIEARRAGTGEAEAKRCNAD